MAKEFTREDRKALAEARLAHFKHVLQLTPAQEKAWPAVEQTLREGAKVRRVRRKEIFEARKAEQSLDLEARLHERAKGLRARADQIEKLATSGKQLLDSLDEGQRLRFRYLLRKAARRRAGLRKWGRLARYMDRRQAKAQA